MDGVWIVEHDVGDYELGDYIVAVCEDEMEARQIAEHHNKHYSTGSGRTDVWFASFDTFADYMGWHNRQIQEANNKHANNDNYGRVKEYEGWRWMS